MKILISIIPIILQIIATISSILGIIVSIYAIRKLREEIKNLTAKPEGEKEEILRPTLTDILRFEGDAQKYAKWQEQQTEEKSTGTYYTILVPFFFVSFHRLIGKFQMHTNILVPSRILKRLKTNMVVLSLFGFAMFIFFSLLLFQLNITAGMTLWPIWDVKIPPIISALFVGYYVSIGFVYLVQKTLLRV